MPRIEYMEQLSPEWFAARLGNPGASSFSKIITSTGKPSTQATDYMYQLAGEFVRGEAEFIEPTIHMQNGIEREAKARISFEMETGLDVEQVGLVYTDDKRAHCSPDGLMPDLERGIEIKCPIASTHAGYLIDNKLPTDYIQQVQGSMLVTGYKEWVFMSYYPGVKQLILTIERDEDYINLLRAELDKFTGNLQKAINEIQS